MGCSDDEVDDEYIEFRLTPKDIKHHAQTTKKANIPYIGSNSRPYAEESPEFNIAALEEYEFSET